MMRPSKLPFPSSWLVLVAVAVAAATNALVACSSSDEVSDPASDDASTSVPSESADSGAPAAPTFEDGGSAAATDGSSTSDASLTAPGSAFSGRLSMILDQERVATDGGARYSVGAFASVFNGHSPSFACVESTVNAACVAFSCTMEEDASAPVANAGDITIRGGSGGIDGGIVLAPLTPGSYATSPATFAELANEPAPYMKGGDMITFAAAGTPGGIGAFSVTLPAVTDVSITQPVRTLPEAGSYEHPTTSFPEGRDLIVAWSPGAAPGSTIFVTIGATTVSTRSTQIIECSFDPMTASQGTVPLRETSPPFPRVDGVHVTGQLDVQPRASATFTAGNAGGAKTDPDAWTVLAEVDGTDFGADFTMTDGG